jgi:hypothetical protein
MIPELLAFDAQPTPEPIDFGMHYEEPGDASD